MSVISRRNCARISGSQNDMKHRCFQDLEEEEHAMLVLKYP